MLSAIVTHRWPGAFNKVCGWPSSSDHEVKMGSLDNEGFLRFATRVFFPFIMSKVKNNSCNEGLVCCLEECQTLVSSNSLHLNSTFLWIDHTWCFLLCKKMIQWVCQQEYTTQSTGQFDYFHSQSILSPVRKVGGYKSRVSTPASIRCFFTAEIFTCKITTHNEQMWQSKVDYHRKPITP